MARRAVAPLPAPRRRPRRRGRRPHRPCRRDADLRAAENRSAPRCHGGAHGRDPRHRDAARQRQGNHHREARLHRPRRRHRRTGRRDAAPAALSRGTAMGERPLPSLHPASLLATWFGAGLLPLAPGTWGSLAALPFAWAIATFFGQPALLIAAAIVFCVGWWAAAEVGRASGITDDGSIVIDEVAGQWLTLTVVAPSAATYVLGFLL